MTAPKFTPGPWRVVEDSDGGSHILAGSDDVFIRIAETTNDYPSPDQENARLISAAPEMYEALQSLVDFDNVSLRSPNGSISEPYRQELFNRKERARAALEKASGGRDD